MGLSEASVEINAETRLRDLAAQIHGAVFKPLDGDDHFLMLNSERTQSNECIRLIEAFVES